MNEETENSREVIELLAELKLKASTQDRPSAITEHFRESQLAVELLHVRVGSVDDAVDAARAVCSKGGKQHAHQTLAHRLIGFELVFEETASHNRGIGSENGGGAIVFEVVEPVDGVFCRLGEIGGFEEGNWILFAHLRQPKSLGEEKALAVNRRVSTETHFLASIEQLRV
jgi:hypothetical protein